MIGSPIMTWTFFMWKIKINCYDHMHLQAIAPLPPINQEDGLSLTCICLNSHHQPSWVHPMINIQRDILFSSLTFQLNKIK